MLKNMTINSTFIAGPRTSQYIVIIDGTAVMLNMKITWEIHASAIAFGTIFAKAELCFDP